MGYTQYADTRKWKVADTDEMVRLGGFKPGYNQELRFIRSELRIYGGLGGSERIRLNFYADTNYSRLLFQSDWHDITNIEAAHWMGWVRFDFDRRPINKHTFYYLAFEFENYTRTGNARYLAFALDWPHPKNTHLTAPFYGLTAMFYGYR